MNYVKINGVPFDGIGAAISEYEESFDVLDGPSAGRVRSGRMTRDIIGTYIGHKITFFNGDVEVFDRLWSYLVEHSVDESVMLEVADGQSTISYEAYYTSGKRHIRSVINGKNIWDELEINFIPMEPQVTP